MEKLDRDRDRESRRKRRGARARRMVQAVTKSDMFGLDLSLPTDLAPFILPDMKETLMTLRTQTFGGDIATFLDERDPSVPPWLRKFVSIVSEGPGKGASMDDSGKRRAGRAAAHAISNIAASEASPDSGRIARNVLWIIPSTC